MVNFCTYALLYSNKFCLIILLVVLIDVIGSMELINSMEFVVLWPSRVIEAGSNCAIYDIPEAFFIMRVGVEVSKLHVISCVHHFKCFFGIKFMESSDKDIEIFGLGSDFVRQDSFNFCFVLFV